MPFWSPGSDYVGYRAANDLRKVAARGGPSTTLCRLADMLLGAAWRTDGTIVFSVLTTVPRAHLEVVSSQGGEPELFLEPDSARSEVGIYIPRALPDGRGLVMGVQYQDTSYELVVQTEGGRHVLVRVPSREAIWGLAVSATGHILYAPARQAFRHNADLWAVPVEPGTWTAAGEPFVIARHASYPSVSADGTLAYLSAPGEAGRRQLAWVDRSGAVLDTIGQPQDAMTSPALSPDGRFVAVAGMEQGKRDIWLHDVERDTKTRLSYDLPSAWRPSWSPDGDRIVFQSMGPAQNLKRDLYLQATDGRSPPKPLVKTDADEVAPHWSPDRETILYSVLQPDGDRDLWRLSLSDPENPKVFLQTPFRESWPCFSPDGRYVAYKSNKSGRNEIYVTRFPDAEGERTVSVDGGAFPQWRGEEIFYVDRKTNTLMAAQVRTRPEFQAELPRPVFRGEPLNADLARIDTSNFTVSSDGQHFGVVQAVEAGEQTAPAITVVENWIKEFEDQQ